MVVVWAKKTRTNTGTEIYVKLNVYVLLSVYMTEVVNNTIIKLYILICVLSFILDQCMYCILSTEYTSSYTYI